MSTAEVAKAAGVHPDTVRANAKKIGGRNLGGSHGWEFSPKAPAQLLDILHSKATKVYGQRALEKALAGGCE